ncbi:MAG: efflux RND transporter periplasmic adaptor subunit [Ruminococcaceae bacterium]|nr:efflux RND transporter periplasmic adaptor subunit [Oscillospiraceae bacterium]
MFALNKLKGIAVLLSVSMLVFFAGCGEKTKKVSKESSVNVTVSEVKLQTIEETATYTGELKAGESTSVSAKVSGNVEAIYCEVGDYVNEGDVLLQIDDTDYRTQYNQANAAYQAALSQSKTVVSSAQIEYNNAKTNLENQKVLYESGAISKLAYDAAVTRYDNAKINLDAAVEQSGVGSAKAMLDAAQNSLNYTTIKAPISGYISNKNANVGQMAAPGVEIFSIKKTEKINAQINVTESIISKVTVGAKAKIKVDSVDEEIEGNVTVANPTKNAQTGMYYISISIDNADGILKDGMFADITLTLSDSADTLVVPSDSVIEDEDGKKYVYITDGETAEKIEVTVGIVTEEYTEIIKGVSEGDKVIVTGKEYLSEENNNIKIVK